MAIDLSSPIGQKRARRAFNAGRNLHMGDVVQMADGQRGVYQGLSTRRAHAKDISTSITIDLSPCSKHSYKIEAGHILPSSINVGGREVNIHYQQVGIKEILPAFTSVPYYY